MTAAIEMGYQPGCIGWAAQEHARYYSQSVGFGLPFEARVASELSEFCSRYDESRDGLWLARAEGQFVGSVAIDGPSGNEELAHLRWFIVSDACRGTGVGRSLLGEALKFCKDRGFNGVYLWTFDGLGAARHLYESAGFRLVQQHAGSRWGKEVLEQRFELRA